MARSLDAQISHDRDRRLAAPDHDYQAPVLAAKPAAKLAEVHFHAAASRALAATDALPVVRFLVSVPDPAHAALHFHYLPDPVRDVRRGDCRRVRLLQIR